MKIYCYLDNAATSFPKPVGVIRAAEEIISGKYGNPGRSGHFLSRNSQDKVFEARLTLSEFLGSDSPENIVFTHNATYALNIAITGTVYALISCGFEKPKVITSVFEHNSVLRPLYRLEREGKISLEIVSFENCTDKTAHFASKIKKGTSLAVITLLSNTAGDFFDADIIGKKAKECGTVFIADASQACGILPISIEKSGIDILCVPCHKGLLGIMGAGFLAFSKSPKLLPEAVICGGSGSESRNRFMPDALPDRLEAGTLAVPAIASVTKGIEYINKVSLKAIEEKEKYLKKLMLSKLENIKGINLYGKNNPIGPILFNSDNIPPETFSRMLDEENIATRAGFHCAPLAHDYYSTGKNGAVRLSFGVFNTEEEILYAADKIRRLAEN